MKVLVDTSVWSAVLRRQIPRDYKKTTEILTDLLRDLRVVLIGPIRQELLSGISSPALFQKLKEKLSGLTDFPLDTAVYELAAEYANICRRHGVQGSHTDFLICAAAVQNNWEIFTEDKDFQNYKKYLPLKLFTPTN
ncbi:MAG: PIN domain-containing protein [Candidatus Margulisbacteria bacterium]|jgi:predicted nucleic acid-binding protein|nr:PIN domain-containing protein [Candidatus Margulisiibacteriota bacterium]